MVGWILRSVQILLVLFAIVVAVIGIVWVADPGESQLQECYTERDDISLRLAPDFTPSEPLTVQTCLNEWDATKQGLTMGVVALAMGVCAIALHPVGQFAATRSKTKQSGWAAPAQAGYPTGQYPQQAQQQTQYQQPQTPPPGQPQQGYPPG